MLAKQPPQLARTDAEPVCEALDIRFIEATGFDQARAHGKRCWWCRRQNARSGDVSGRQRRHGRKPASWAAAAEG